MTVDGVSLTAFEGESLAVALGAGGIGAFRRSVRHGAPRGPFCHMGICQECLVLIDGVRVQSCLIAVRDGLAVALLKTDLDDDA